MENRNYAESLGYVESEQFMLVIEGETHILGMISFRHYLNQSLEKAGGHIGYSIRPSEWRKGYGKAMISLCLYTKSSDMRKFNHPSIMSV
jgi:predicted acetyltransferase